MMMLRPSYRKSILLGWLLPVLVLVVWPLLGADTNIKWPAETARLKPGPGAELATAHCLICHSADYISTQPPMPRAFWKGSVQKMQQKYGAPIPEVQVERLVDYLFQAYGREKPSGDKTPPK
jgi:hypothetical protein